MTSINMGEGWFLVIKDEKRGHWSAHGWFETLEEAQEARAQHAGQRCQCWSEHTTFGLVGLGAYISDHVIATVPDSLNKTEYQARIAQIDAEYDAQIANRKPWWKFWV